MKKRYWIIGALVLLLLMGMCMGEDESSYEPAPEPEYNEAESLRVAQEMYGEPTRTPAAATDSAGGYKEVSFSELPLETGAYAFDANGHEGTMYLAVKDKSVSILLDFDEDAFDTNYMVLDRIAHNGKYEYRLSYLTLYSARFLTDGDSICQLFIEGDSNDLGSYYVDLYSYLELSLEQTEDKIREICRRELESR